MPWILTDAVPSDRNYKGKRRFFNIERKKKYSLVSELLPLSFKYLSGDICWHLQWAATECGMESKESHLLHI